MSAAQGKRAALYLRVSTSGQTTANQRRELEKVAQQRGWEVVAVYEDAGISGAKGREGRPALDKMQREAAQGRFDVLLSWSVDRLGRSLAQLVGLMQELRSLNVGLYLHQQALDTSTPAGQAMLAMCGVFAEFERAMIVERVKAGLARAKVSPKPGKKAPGRPRVGAEVEGAIRRLRRRGKGIRAIAEELG
jgi:DNA invertase Pin-like site-specific DNA recombinase